MEDTSNTESTYIDFIQKAVAHDEVWGLEGEEGLATSSSSENDEQDVIPFWSDEALAKAVAVDDWADFKPSSMSVAEFLENWLVGMHNDELLVGTNWDAKLNGREVEPLIIALDLAREIEATAKAIDLVHYKDIKDFQEQVREASGLSQRDL